jgi:4-alpha-glucanotransferase
MPLVSLPSRFGIGDLGPTALAWIDRLREAGQSWWQALPLGPTGYGNSPYQPLSSFAGNELVVSPEGLTEEGLLRPEDYGEYPTSLEIIDYPAVISFKYRLMKTAFRNFVTGNAPALRTPFEAFEAAHGYWLNDYALFRALKAKYGGAYYLEWPPELVVRDAFALATARQRLEDQIAEVRFSQFLLFRQAKVLTDYAREKGVHLIGDLPFFVSPDSSDVWANPEFFLLDSGRKPRFVAGVPPDYFSAHGQRWGNPVYGWDALRSTGYRWWIERLRARLAHVHVVRLDHFRAFAAAWHVPVEAETAQTGQWVTGPGADFFHIVEKELSGLPFIAEDLGLITPDVVALRDQFGIPGTRVLQFAFDGSNDNPHLPENYASNTVAYTGTHDNATTRGWFEEMPAHLRQNLWRYLKRQPGSVEEVASALIR